jgi:hypothetical protein
MKLLVASFVVFVTLAGVWSAGVAQEKPPDGGCDPPPETPKPTKK